MPVSEKKTVWSCTQITFLGFLIDVIRQIIAISQEKLNRGLCMVEHALNKGNKKLTLYQIQKLHGFLNFLCLAVIPGRAFTRCLYALTAGKQNLKSYHHIRMTKETLEDLCMRRTFLLHPTAYYRNFMDFTKVWTAVEIDFYSDASKNPKLAFGAKCGEEWLYASWDKKFILDKDPSIAYLELFALTAEFLTWGQKFNNKRIIIFCDNQSVVAMLNNTSSNCKNCMRLIRLIVLHSLIHNIRVFGKFVPTKENIFADSLLRLKINYFKSLVNSQKIAIREHPEEIPEAIWPMNKIWVD